MLKDGYTNYFTSALYPLLFTAGAAYVCVKGTTVQKERLVYLPLIITVLTICNPIYWKIANKAASYAYYRAYWAIPLFFIIACMAVCAARGRSNRRRTVLATAFALIIVIWGSADYGGLDDFNMITNIYKLPDEAIEVTELLKEEGAEGKLVLAPGDINRYIRQYDADILLCLNNWTSALYNDRNDDNYRASKAYIDSLINSASADYEALTEIMSSEGCEYLVLKKSQSEGQDGAEYGLTPAGETEEYIIWRRS